MYQLIRPLLFKLDAERSHELTINGLAKLSQNQFACKLIKTLYPTTNSPVEVMGLNFPNRLGLAAGLDKHAQCINAFSAFGFGFIETGTVTPLPQSGNEKPRLFRLQSNEAIINRMGFNSVGLDQFIGNFKQHDCPAVVGINLGKNAVTPIENALDDYLIGVERTYPLADYLSINLSSPNTKNLRQLQSGDHFEHLIKHLKQAQTRLTEQHGKYTPIAIKIAPDLSLDEIESIASICMKQHVDAIIATNTTIDKSSLGNHPLANEAGGLSGKPLTEQSTWVIRQLANTLQGAIPIIGAGGIHDGKSAQDKLDAGASLIQVYSALIYQGPGLISRIINAVA